jgi:hypothetical protein
MKIDRVPSISFLGLCINGEICQKKRYFSTGHDQLCPFERPFFSIGPGWLNELGSWVTQQLIQAYHQYGVGSRPAL